MIEYIKGNLLEADADIIVHGCNCFHTMGAGVARQIAQKYPGAYEADKQTPWGSRSKLGTYSIWWGALELDSDHDDLPIIINAYTQYNFGSGIHLDYGALEKAMITINKAFMSCWQIAMPKIGAGLAGGDWNRIEEILNKVFDDRTIHVYEL